VLLVEDEEIVRELAREILEMCGYQVLVAANGSEALRACREHKGEIQLILTDVIMPQMSGRQLKEALATLRPGTSVLYMSGHAEDAVIRHGAHNEGVAFIQKPFTPETLARKVRQVVDATPSGRAVPV
jgi:CheY-like chemotaxis protein